MNPSLNSYEFLVSERIEFEKTATALIKLVGDLFYERNLEVVLFRQQLLDQRPSEMLKAHSHASIMAGESLNVQDTLAMVKSLSNSQVRNTTIDVGKLAIEWKREAGIFLKRRKFLDSKLNAFYNIDNNEPKPIDVVLYGFGRIGRLVARELIAQEGKGNQLRMRAIVIRGKIDRVNLEKRASNLRVDSIHGHFPGTVDVDFDNSSLIINERPIKVISSNSKEAINYEKYGIHDSL